MKYLPLFFLFLTATLQGEQTFSMIKPHAVKEHHIGAILEQIEASGLSIEALRMKKLTTKEASEFYKEHNSRPFFADLVAMMSSAPVVAFVVSGDNAIQKLRSIAGTTDPTKAEEGTIRKKFGVNITENALHSSDSPESAKREIEIFFTPEEIFTH